MGELDQAQELSATTPGPPSTLYYGPPGSGKTTLALHKPGKKFLIDADNKAHEMENLPPWVRDACTVWSCPDTIPGGQLDVIAKATKIRSDPSGFRRIVTVINELLAIARDGKREGKVFPYEVVILDSWTAVSDHAFDKVKYDQGVSKLSWQEWGLLHANNVAVLKGLLQLPCERIVIAHDVHKTIRDPETQEVKEEYIRPAVPGQLSDTFAKYFTEVYYFLGRERSGDYKIQTVRDRLLVARTAKGLPPEVVISQETKQFKLPTSRG